MGDTKHMLIDGQWVGGSDDQTVDVVNPATGESLGRVALATTSDADRAVSAARLGQAEWADSSALARAEILLNWARRVRDHQLELAKLLTQEGGSVLVENMDEIRWVAEVLEYYAELGRNAGGRVLPSQEPTLTNLVVKRPVGVVVAIAPWNYPALLLWWKIAPALAAGNSVIVKPPVETPLTVMRIIELLEAPRGVVQVLNGGAELGEHLVSHPGTDLIAFTGSVGAGKAILRSSVEHVKRVTLELSGHDPFIVCDDVDVDDAVEATLWAAFTNAGQVCTSAERIYVMRGIYDEFVEKFVRRAGELIVGDPLDLNTDIGALATADQIERAEQYLRDAIDAGATIQTGGKRIEGAGLFFEPTVLTGVSHDELKRLGEVFGPIAPIVPIDSFDEAIEKANDSEMGLGANVLTSDLERGMRASKELRFGLVWVNNPLVDNDAGPFGGMRTSGLGRELGDEGLESYMETTHVSLDYRLEKKYWWYPYSNYSDAMGLRDGRSSGFLGGHAGAAIRTDNEVEH